MRLLFTATAYPPSTGGAQLHHHLLAQHLRQQHDVQVVCQWTTNRTDWLLGTTLRAPLKSQSYEIDGIEVHQLGLSMVERIRLLLPVIGYYPLMKFALPQITSCLKRRLQLHANDVDLVHNVRLGREGLSYASYEFAQERNIPFVLTPVHHPRWIGWRYNAYIKLYQKADAVIALTNTEKQILVDLGVLPEKVYVTGVGPITAANAYPERFLKNHNIYGPIVLFLGQHYTYKGYQQVIESTHLVWQDVPDAHFVFIGPGAGRSEQIFQALHDPRIHRLGKVDLQTKTDALAACSLLCVPSSQESFGGVYVEAWSMGKPVIGCKIPAVSEVITDEVDGYLVEQRSEQIADRIKFLLLNQTRAQNMGENGQTKVLKKYTWPRLATLTEQIYRKTIEAKAERVNNNGTRKSDNY